MLARSLYDGKKQGESDRPGENNETTLSTLTPCPDAANTLLPSRTTLFFWDTRECAVNVLASSGPSGLPLEESENRQVLNGRAYSKRASSRMFYSYLSSTWYAGVTFPLACPCVHFSLRVANLNQAEVVSLSLRFQNMSKDGGCGWRNGEGLPFAPSPSPSCDRLCTERSEPQATKGCRFMCRVCTIKVTEFELCPQICALNLVRPDAGETRLRQTAETEESVKGKGGAEN